nr:methylmalonyl-CoA mutase family protein [Fodinicola feengrottensis]
MALANRSSAEFPQLRAIVADGTPYHEAGGSEAEELGCTLATGVAYLRALTDAGLTVDQACQQLEFRYAATADQFLTIAKLRAARRLWSRVTEVSGASAGVRAQRQHAVTSAAMMTRRDPWVNMLRTTLACFGAGVGGAEAITVLPFDSALGLPDSFARRIARNTQALLMDESHVARVIDPAGGGLVRGEPDRRAGARGLEMVPGHRKKAGGLDSGIVQERIAATRQRRRDAIAHRRDPITGVSEFPFLAEKPVARTAAPAIDSGGLPRYRYAEDYERLRDRSDAYLDSTGDRPKIFLATLDRVAVHTARATFASNLFQAGGIEPVTPGQLTQLPRLPRPSQPAARRSRASARPTRSMPSTLLTPQKLLKRPDRSRFCLLENRKTTTAWTVSYVPEATRSRSSPPCWSCWRCRRERDPGFQYGRTGRRDHGRHHRKLAVCRTEGDRQGRRRARLGDPGRHRRTPRLHRRRSVRCGLP